MKRKILLLLSVLLVLPTLAAAQEVMVTRGFTGLWDQYEHENQGINLQVVEQPGGEKEGVAFWFTYGDDMTSAWFIGIGPVSGSRIEMKLYEVSGVGFLEENNPDKDAVEDIGEMKIEFSSCDEGEVTFNTDIAGVGSGVFPIVRLTNMINTQCSGGISDDTPANVLVTEQRISLSPARNGINGSGHADFVERPDRTEFSVEAEDVANGSYRIFVGGVDRGELVVSLGRGETEFRSPVEAGKVLLTFDPRGELVEVRDDQGAVLTSGNAVFTVGDDSGGDDSGSGSTGGSIDFGTAKIEVDLGNTGVYPAASGDVRLRPRSDRTDFSVEIEDVPVGSYDLRIGGNVVGTIQVTMLQDGSIQGELEFRNPVEPGKVLLDFDPRGQQIDVLDGTTEVLETFFPSS
ncbi:hypothetical protein ACFL00_01250 [Pseudomonadota bacterium]